MGEQLSAYTGADAGKDTEFLVYGQTTAANGVAKDASIHPRRPGRRHHPRRVPAGRVDVPMWAANGTASAPPSPLNQTEAWWLGPNKSFAGSTVSVYGQRNLSYYDSTYTGTNLSWIYISPPTARGPVGY